MAEFNEYVSKLCYRLGKIKSLFSAEEVIISYDKLKNEIEVEDEVLYFKANDEEFLGMFVFGSSFFEKELAEQEFKKMLNMNSLNFKIVRAYKQISENQKKVKIGDILNQIQDQKKDSYDIHRILRRILTLAYYFDWEIKKDKSDLEKDSYITIPDRFLVRLKQRYDFTNLSSIYENEKVFLFVNGRGKLNLVYKNKDSFTRKDIERDVFDIIKKVFNVKKVLNEIDL